MHLAFISLRLRFALWPSLALATAVQAQAASDAPSNLRPQDVAVLAATCANCHGPDGRSTGGIPSLRGVDTAYLLARLQAFKAGAATDVTVMTRLAKGYEDEQIKALATWFSKEGK